MQSLYFQDDNITTNANGKKLYYVRLTYNNMSINIYDMIKYEPYDATNIEVSYKLNNYKIAKITSTGMLTFEESVVKNNSFTSLEVTITSKDNLTLSDTLTIMNIKFKDSNSESYDDFIFGEF